LIEKNDLSMEKVLLETMATAKIRDEEARVGE
jgi:hypothetical protein